MVRLLNPRIRFADHSNAVFDQPVSRVHRCPKCDGIGKPINLKSEPGAVVLSFRCPYCHHAWSVKQEHPNDAA